MSDGVLRHFYVINKGASGALIDRLRGKSRRSGLTFTHKFDSLSRIEDTEHLGDFVQDEEASPDDGCAGRRIVAAIQIASEAGDPQHRLAQGWQTHRVQATGGPVPEAAAGARACSAVSGALCLRAT